MIADKVTARLLSAQYVYNAGWQHTTAVLGNDTMLTQQLATDGQVGI